jgi:hypothetical protein
MSEWKELYLEQKKLYEMLKQRFAVYQSNEVKPKKKKIPAHSFKVIAAGKSFENEPPFAPQTPS